MHAKKTNGTQRAVTFLRGLVTMAGGFGRFPSRFRFDLDTGMGVGR
jgi:hypothetical protein